MYRVAMQLCGRWHRALPVYLPSCSFRGYCYRSNRPDSSPDFRLAYGSGLKQQAVKLVKLIQSGMVKKFELNMLNVRAV